jgi:hypothetical protein
VVDWRYAQAAANLQKVAGRTRAIFDSLAALMAVDGGPSHQEAAGDADRDDLVPGAGRGRSAAEPPCLALFGEFSAGKSSLANLLIGTDMLPTSVLSSTRLPTRLCHAKSLRVTAVTPAGERLDLSPEQLRHLSRNQLCMVEIGLPGLILRHLEILDTPGFADPYHEPELAMAAADQAHLAIWCTLASQAWRQTEQFTWKSLPARLRTTGLLVVTHVDQLREPGDREQLLARLQQEAGPWFRDIVLLSVPDAVAARDQETGDLDQVLWQSSGGALLFEKLETALAVTAEQRHRAAGHAGRRSSPKAVPPPADTQPEIALPPAAAPSAPLAAGKKTVVDHDPPPATVYPAAAAAVRGEVPPEPAKIEAVLGELLADLADCALAGYIDLEARRLLAVQARKPTPPSLDERVAAFGTALLQGEPVEVIRSMIEAHQGIARADRDTFQEITIRTGHAVHLLLRLPLRSDRGAFLVCRPEANITLVRLKARRAFAGLDRPG